MLIYLGTHNKQIAFRSQNGQSIKLGEDSIVLKSNQTILLGIPRFYLACRSAHRHAYAVS